MRNTLVNTIRSVPYRIAVVSLFLLGAFAASVFAVPVLNPTNGHYYEWIEALELTANWQNAKLAAEGRTFLGVHGHLTTITSQQEQNFLNAAFPTAYGWLGAHQALGAVEPGQGWQWVTGEPFIYQNWDLGEPNNIFGNNPNENALSSQNVGFWNDAADTNVTRFFVEYPVPEPSAFAAIAIAVLLGLPSHRLPRKSSVKHGF